MKEVSLVSFFIVGSEKFSLHFQRNEMSDRSLFASRKFCENLVLYPISKDCIRGQFGMAVTKTIYLYRTLCFGFSPKFFDKFYPEK